MLPCRKHLGFHQVVFTESEDLIVSVAYNLGKRGKQPKLL